MRSLAVLQFVMDSLHYWVTEMHVDGLHFDLASTLVHQFHEVDKLSAFFDITHQDPVLFQVKLIAEPWDVGDGDYNVDDLPVLQSEWNGKYRDTVHGFWCGGSSTLGEFISRITGSSDLYQCARHAPVVSINFVTTHGGFTLRGLASYNEKYSEANLESNADGNNNNRSWNCDVEGPTNDPTIAELRQRQTCNFLTTVLFSQGAPIVCHDDEMGRTQGGNNNTYCQNNETSWINWDLSEQGNDLLEFTHTMMWLRHDHPVLRHRRFFIEDARHSGESELGEIERLIPAGKSMTDQDQTIQHARAMMIFLNREAIAGPDEWGQRIVDDSFLVLINTSDEGITFILPGKGYAPTREVALDATPAVDGNSDPVLAIDDTAVVEACPMLPLIDAPESAVITERHPRQGLSATLRRTTEHTSPIKRHYPAQIRQASGSNVTDAVDVATNQAGSAGSAETPAYAPQSGHVPTSEHRTPVTIYRLQLGEDLTFVDAKALIPYLTDLGVTGLYLSPIFTAAPGSTHSYDIIDHRRVSAIMGGREQLEALVAGASVHGMGVMMDIVPNHTAISIPGWHNLPLWLVLREGPDLPYAAWSDLSLDRPILMPILGKRIGAILTDDELTLEQMVVPGQEDLGEQQVLRYYDHAFPITRGIEALPMHILIERRHYRLAYWRVGDEEINYQRFFDVGTLAAIRVEELNVFTRSHGLILDLMRDGVISALRIDRPDGLADPGDCLTQLAEVTGGMWVAAEKTLAPDESLPTSWPAAETTGYDATRRVDQLQVNPVGAARLGVLMQELTGDASVDYDRIVGETKREAIAGLLAAGADRLARVLNSPTSQGTRLRDYTLHDLRARVVELLVATDQYRAYIAPGVSSGLEAAAVLQVDAEWTCQHLEPDQGEALDLVVVTLPGEPVGSEDLLGSPERTEAITRFQQVCGAVTTKGVEDVVFYRQTHLTSFTEIGDNPAGFALSADETHTWASRIQNTRSDTMVTSATRDTKCDEDVRAHLDVLTFYTEEQSNLIHHLRAMTVQARPPDLDGRSENLLWQILWGI